MRDLTHLRDIECAIAARKLGVTIEDMADLTLSDMISGPSEAPSWLSGFTVADTSEFTAERGGWCGVGD